MASPKKQAQKATGKAAPAPMTPVKKREAKASAKQSSARKISDKAFRQKMTQMQAEIQGGDSPPASPEKKKLFSAQKQTPKASAKRPAQSQIQSAASKRARK
jgi:hypothetical protein